MDHEEYIKHLEEISNGLIEANKINTKEFQKTFRLLLVLLTIMLVLICIFNIIISPRNPTNENRNINYNQNGGSGHG